MSFSWAGYKWRTTLPNQPSYSDPKRKFWADEKAISIDNNGYLHLFTRYNPKQFSMGKPLVGAGLISTEKVFKHGVFNISCQLPSGKNLWPAFWCLGSRTWPPEVDVFEGYSDSFGSYMKFDFWNPLAIWNVETNAFYGDVANGGLKNLKNIGAKPHRQLQGDPSKRFEYYTMRWEPNKIELSYGSKVVREIDNSDLLTKLNDQGMHIVLNNAVANDADNLENHKTSDFIIKYFSYKPL